MGLFLEAGDLLLFSGFPEMLSSRLQPCSRQPVRLGGVDECGSTSCGLANTEGR